MRKLLALLAVLWSGAAFAAPGTPINPQVDCVVSSSTFVTTPTTCDDINGVRFKWDAASGGAADDYNAYQINVDTDSPPRACAFNWNSGAVAIGSTVTTSTVTFPTTHTGSCSGGSATLASQGPWTGVRGFYWNVRVSDDGGATWSAYTATQRFSYENLPTFPASLAVASGAGGGAKENFGDTSAGTTRHASTVGSGTACSSGTPCSLATAVSQAVAGDIIALASGTYSAPTLSSSGTKAKPITILEETAATATVTGTLTLDRNYWVIDGLTFSGSGRAINNQTSFTMVKNCSFVGDDGAAEGVVNWGGGTSNYFINNLVSTTSGEAGVFLRGGGPDMLLRGNEITGSSTSRGVNSTGGSGRGNRIIAENYIHHLSEVGYSDYYGAQELFLTRNYIRNIGSGTVIRWSRGGWGRTLNNTLGSYPGSDGAGICYTPNDGDGQPTINNDICLSSGTVFQQIDSAWLRLNKIQYRYSVHFPKTGTGDSNLTEASECGGLTGALCIDLISTAKLDPVIDSTGHAVSASSTNIIDKGNPVSPIPAGGGSRVDIGRYEFGATIVGDAETGTYDYQPLWTGVNATPRISWAFSDPDNTFFTAAQTQFAYEVQIDPLNTFDSVGPWKPFCSSGVVASAAAFWDVPGQTDPNPCGLAGNTKYYVRVRTYDNVATTEPGSWTDYANAFTTAASGNNYYVSTTGNDTTGTGTLALPFRTWAKAISVIVPGDTVYGRGGTYAETAFNLPNTKDGTASSFVTLTNYQGENVIINTAGSNNCCGGGPGLGVGAEIRADYAVIRGLKFTGAPDEGIFVDNAVGVTIDQCESYDNSTVAARAQNNLQAGAGATGLTVTRSKFYWNQPAFGTTRGSHNVYLIGSNITFTNNIIYNTESTATGSYGIQVGTSDGVAYANNTIAFNTIVNTTRRPGLIVYTGGIAGGVQTNARVYNNIFRGCSLIAGQGCMAVNTGGDTTSTITFANNIVSNYTATGGANNWLDVTGSIPTITPTNTIVAAGTTIFTDEANRDLHITSTSPAKDTATNAFTVYSPDYDGDIRPSGAFSDIGADESTATQTCGNNIREGTEVCDGTDLNSQTCISRGFAGGTLSCTACAFNESLCTISTSQSAKMQGVKISGGTVK